MPISPDKFGQKIGGVTIHSPVLLAPMRQVTTVSYRRLCSEHGAGLTFTQCVRAPLLLSRHREGRVGRLSDVSPLEGTVGVQLSAAEPVSAAEATELVVGFGYALVDLNFGCPQVERRGALEGAALMRFPDRVGRIVEAVVRAARGAPVTVKMRAGADDASRNAVEVAKVAEGAGAAAVTVHGRTGTHGYLGKADWGVIAAVKRAVTIPVVGNGDVWTVEDVTAMFRATNCDFVMVGRGAFGNPWLFRQASEYLLTGRVPREPSLAERLRMYARYVELAREHADHPRGITEAAYRYEAVAGKRGAGAWGHRASPLQRTRSGRLLLAARRLQRSLSR